MNNVQQRGFALLLHAGVQVEIISFVGGVWNDIGYEYTIYIPAIQKYLVEKESGSDSLDDFDGIHQYDFSEYVGQGYTLEEAFENFLKANSDQDIEAYMGRVGELYSNYSDALKFYVTEVIDKLEEEN